MSTTDTPGKPKPADSCFSSTHSHSHHELAPTPLRPSAPQAGCRSVKSIVAWLESSSSSQSWPSRSTTVDMTHDLSANSISTCHNHSVSGASDVEEYSLTYLKYKNYFTSVPLRRCLEYQETPLQVEGNPSPAMQIDDRCAQDGQQMKQNIELTPPQEVATVMARPRFIQRDPDEVEAF
ncbi:hypothetical protein QQS21_005939 [Conoideocrella luteorostrata]|uniref:Uncharacterized protein n=1 Tax=Conoideocrella luteorostrata TaxID=1105319 RepID=A0AAJ0CQZ7_9HYPO|nr:hypothetical protein QQS21_005939 [Conoideocrella luteorostrata]